MGAFPRTSTDDGVRWNTVRWPAASARWGTICTAVAPVPMTATRFPARPSRPPSGLPPVTA